MGGVWLKVAPGFAARNVISPPADNPDATLLGLPWNVALALVAALITGACFAVTVVTVIRNRGLARRCQAAYEQHFADAERTHRWEHSTGTAQGYYQTFCRHGKIRRDYNDDGPDRTELVLLPPEPPAQHDGTRFVSNVWPQWAPHLLVYSFTTRQGATITGIPRNTPAATVDMVTEPVPILYCPDNPEYFVVSDWKGTRASQGVSHAS